MGLIILEDNHATKKHQLGYYVVVEFLSVDLTTVKIF